MAYRELLFRRDEVRFLFYNPNIHPYMEYRRRLDSFVAYMEQEGYSYEILPYEPEEWIRAISFREENRCEICYRMRLRKAADYAVEEGFAVFTTTLLASPHQNHETLRLLGSSIAASRGLEFREWDGRERYRERLQESRERGFYLQPYCGCILSERERYDKTLREAKKS
jgi:hypothetical protein